MYIQVLLLLNTRDLETIYSFNQVKVLAIAIRQNVNKKKLESMCKQSTLIVV